MKESTSKAASAQYRVECSYCGAKIGEPCRTLKTRRVTDTHVDRIHDWFQLWRKGEL